jgi:competence protein ComEA
VVAAPSEPTSASSSPALLTSPSASASSGTTGSGPSGATEVVVHDAGKVRRPGIVVLPTGSRVVDAVRRAGGFAAGVGPRSAALNLARVLVDGEQIVVGGRPGAPVAGAAAPVPGGGASPGAMVSLNTADQTALESLPGVGPVTATAILQWRSEHGPFTAVEELLEVSGIGEATLAEIEPHVTL